MKQVLLILTAVVVGCGKKPESPMVVPNKLINNPVVEKAIRKSLKKPAGELTKADLEKVTELSLSDNKLTQVPKGLEKLTQLERLHLHDNQLTSMKGLENLTQLKSLYLYDNQLTEVTGLENLTQLKELGLGENQLTDVTGLENLTQLTYLSLSENQLTNVKGLEKLTQLKKLYLWHNKLIEVPKGLKKLTQLEFLGLKGNPDLTQARIDQLQLHKALPKCWFD